MILVNNYDCKNKMFVLKSHREGDFIMTENIGLVAGKLRRWETYLDDFKLPTWNEIPDIGLFMDQVITLLTQYLDYLPPELKEDSCITPAAINNYVRMKIMTDQKKKRY